MRESIDERVACRVCGQPLEDGSGICPACARNQTQTRTALTSTALLTVVLIVLALVLAAVEWPWH